MKNWHIIIEKTFDIGFLYPKQYNRSMKSDLETGVFLN